MSTCVEKAKSNMPAGQATNYCACMLAKIEALYPQAEEATGMTVAQTTEMAKECLTP